MRRSTMGRVAWWGPKRRTCKLCGKPRAPDELLTARGKHIECSNRRMRANMIQLRLHAGPLHDHWKERLLRALTKDAA